MGHQKVSKLEVQKGRLKSLFLTMISMNIAIMRFQLTLTNDEKEQKGLKKLIKESEKAQQIVTSITHYEILISLYNTFVNKKEILYITLVKSITNKNTISKWDRTEKGFKEFLKLENEAIESAKEKDREQRETLEFIRKAKEQGKKVEMLFKDGKLKPVIVEEKAN